MTQFNPSDSPSSVGITTAVITPFDRIRWGPILGGLFTSMSALILLSVLGLAIGLSAWDPADSSRAYSISAGIWAIVSALIAFFIGGWIAARSAAAAGERNGMLNGAMVWAVAMPLLLFLLGGGFASLAQTAVAGSNSRVVYLDRNDMTDRAQVASSSSGGDTMPNANRSNEPTPTRSDALTAAKGAWWTLGSLVLGLAAASFGGVSGARTVGRTENPHPISAP